jgi:hypothetical protein
MYNSRKIIQILDNQLLKLESEMAKESQGAVLRQFFFVLDSSYNKNQWVNGLGSLKVKKNIILGTNSRFLQQLQPGDVIYLLNPSKVNEFFHSTSTNPKFYMPKENECVISKVLTDNMLLTLNPCKKPFGFRGDYFIPKRITYDVELPSIELIQQNEKFLSIIDIHMFESIQILKTNLLYYQGNYLFHPGLLVRRPQDTVFKFTIEKMISRNSYLRILLGTDNKYYNNRSPNENEDYELLLNSETGILLKRINDPDKSKFEFYDTEIKSLFTESISIRIIFHNNSIYIGSIDDDKEFSIKIKYPLQMGQSIKYLYFDMLSSNNVNIKDSRKMNFIEQKYLFSIFVYNKKLLLDENATYVEELTGGDYCSPRQTYRKTIVEYTCDKTGINDLVIDKVTELKMCHYKMSVKSKHLCNPNVIMRNKIEKAIAKTKCVIDNGHYNKRSEDFFNV